MEMNSVQFWFPLEFFSLIAFAGHHPPPGIVFRISIRNDSHCRASSNPHEWFWSHYFPAYAQRCKPVGYLAFSGPMRILIPSGLPALQAPSRPSGRLAIRVDTHVSTLKVVVLQRLDADEKYYDLALKDGRVRS